MEARAKIFNILLTVFLILSVTPCYAVKTLSLEDCVGIALKNDPNVRVATEYKNIAKSKVGVAKSDYFPGLNLGANYNYQNNNTSGLYGSTYGNKTGQINLGVNQLIWNFGKTGANINMQKYNLKASTYDLAQAVLNTTYQVKMAYFGVLAALANEDISERTVVIYKLHYQLTKSMFEEGLKSKIDVVNAQANLADSEIQLLSSQMAYQNSVIALSNAMFYTDKESYSVKNTENFNFGDIVEPDSKNIVNVSYKTNEKEDNVIITGIERNNIMENYTFTPFKMTLDEAIDTAYKNRPDLQSLMFVEKSQEEFLKTVKRMYYPALTAGAGYNMRQNYDTQMSANSFTLQAGLNFPLINAMSIKYQIDAGKAYLKIAGDNVDLLKQNVYFEVQRNYVSMVQLEKRIPLLEKKVEYTLENLELADGRYSVGLGDFIELKDAQQNYNNAQLAFVQCVFDYNIARETLQKSIGGG